MTITLAGYLLAPKTWPEISDTQPPAPMKLAVQVYALPGGGSYIPAQFISDDELRGIEKPEEG